MQKKSFNVVFISHKDKSRGVSLSLWTLNDNGNEREMWEKKATFEKIYSISKKKKRKKKK